MGKVMNRIEVINNTDVDKARQGLIPAGEVRSEQVDALVDTGATMMVIPADLAQRLGLSVEGTRKVRDANGQVAEIPWVSGVRQVICGREMTCDALVEAAGTTPLIGQIPLEALELIVDAKSREVRVNPASPDLPLLDLLAAS